MNEELLDELSAAMKRRDKALAARARWQEALEDAEADIRELSSRITEAAESDPEAPTYGNPESVTTSNPSTWVWNGEQEPAHVQEQEHGL